VPSRAKGYGVKQARVLANKIRAQERSALASGNRPARNLVRSWRVSDYRTRKGKQGMTLHGCELIDTITIANDTSPGDLKANVTGTQLANGGSVAGWKINPLTWPLTRLKQFAQLFQKFRFRKLQFIFEASQSDFTGGSMGHYSDFDPTATYTTLNGTFNALRTAAAHEGWREMKIKQDCTATFKPDDPESSFWIAPTGDPRTYQQGSYFMFLQDPWSGASGQSLPQTIGRLYIRYSCEFWEDAILEGTDPNDLPSVSKNSYGWLTFGGAGSGRAVLANSDSLANVAMVLGGSVANQSVPPNAGSIQNVPSIISVSGSGSTFQSTPDFLSLAPSSSYNLILSIHQKGSGFVLSGPKVQNLAAAAGTINQQYTSVSVPSGGTDYFESYFCNFTSSSSGQFVASSSAATGGLSAGSSSTDTSNTYAVYLVPTFQSVQYSGECMYEKCLKDGVAREALLENWVHKNNCKKEHCGFCPQAMLYSMLKQNMSKGQKNTEEEMNYLLGCPSSDEESSCSDEEIVVVKKKKEKEVKKKHHKSLPQTQIIQVSDPLNLAV